jgi:hypothetical protein
MWDDTKEDRRKFMPRSFHNQHKRRMPEMWFCVFKNCEERMERVDAAAAVVV